jgi:trans-aconitate 2-methyltransferase
MDRFDSISLHYRDKALVQQKAAEKLIQLLDPGANADILDVACGPGSVTKALSLLTKGRVVGTDISEGMIQQARKDHPKLEFRRVAAEFLDFKEEFDIVFCNSSFQWFREPQRALVAMHAALRKPGKLGLACPATEDWSPWYARVMAQVREDPRLRDTFAHWKSPWFFLPEAEEYRELFERSGFRTTWFEIASEANQYSPEQAFQVYLSGAGVGYTDPACYDVPVDDEYLRNFNDAVKAAIKAQARAGRVTVDFHRLYYIGQR